MSKLTILIISFIISSCAASMAINPEHGAEVGDLGIGSRQADFEKILGMRDKTLIISDQERVDYYFYNKRVRPSIVRGTMHAGLSVASSGFWDAIGVSFEEKYQKPLYLAVTFNHANIATDIQIVPKLK